jgi:hypothetical protein
MGPDTVEPGSGRAATEMGVVITTHTTQTPRPHRIAFGSRPTAGEAHYD